MTEVAFVTSGLGRAGGANKASVDILASLLATNISTTVISNWRCKLPARVAGRTLDPPIWITPPKEWPRPVDRAFPRRATAWFVTALQDPGWARRLQKLGPPDLTLVNSFGNHLFLERMAQTNPGLHDKPVMIVHGAPDERTFQVSGRSVKWAVEVLREYDSLVFVSSRVQDEWLALDLLADKNSFYIPNCCREDKVIQLLSQNRQRVRKRLGLPGDQFVAVCVASLQPLKGQDLLLRYFPDFSAITPGLMMYLVGPVSLEWAKSLRQQIRTSAFADRLKVLGSKSNALDYIYAADVLILPSRVEAMPLVILEAMALKTPIIASDVAGIPEMIEHNRSGLLFSHDQPMGLVEAFEQMVTNSEKRQSFAECAHQVYWAKFSRAHQVKRYSAAITEMTS
jgi:glycosyltransferase involved in cell wall biosynthesis